MSRTRHPSDKVHLESSLSSLGGIWNVLRSLPESEPPKPLSTKRPSRLHPERRSADFQRPDAAARRVRFFLDLPKVEGVRSLHRIGPASSDGRTTLCSGRNFCTGHQAGLCYLLGIPLHPLVRHDLGRNRSQVWVHRRGAPAPRVQAFHWGNPSCRVSSGGTCAIARRDF